MNSSAEKSTNAVPPDPADDAAFAGRVESAIAVLSPDALGAVCRHAEAEYPEECCGTISGSGVRPSVNVCREGGGAIDARRTFELDAASAVAVAQSAEDSNGVRIVYHSHPDGPAVFSETDRRAAAPAGRPVYPHLCHLVIACTGGRVSQVSLYAWRRDEYVRVASWARAALQRVVAESDAD